MCTYFIQASGPLSLTPPRYPSKGMPLQGTKPKIEIHESMLTGNGAHPANREDWIWASHESPSLFCLPSHCML